MPTPAPTDAPSDNQMFPNVNFSTIASYLNPDYLVNRMITKFRDQIATSQQQDPASLLNAQKNKISDLFATAETWCK